MELTRGQQEYLLELLSAEYTIPEPYRDSVKEAIKRYSSAQYSDDELDFLLSAPQSLAAVLLLNTTDSLQAFARYFALWANCIEYNALDGNSLMEATLINPDPSSRQKLLQVIDTGDHYQVVPAPELRYMPNPRQQETLNLEQSPTRRLKPAPLASALSYRTLEGLMHEFLSYADQNDVLPTANRQQNPQDYLYRLEQELQRTASKQFSWSDLRQQALQLPLINSTYQWNDRQDGLIVPSNIAFINHLNALPVKGHHNTIPVQQSRPTQAAPASPFRVIDQFIAQLNPRRMMKNLSQLRPPKLPPFPFPGPHQHANQQPLHVNQQPLYHNQPSHVVQESPEEVNDYHLAASTAMPNIPHSEPKTFTSASKMPPTKNKYRLPPLPAPIPRPEPPRPTPPRQSALPPLTPFPGQMRGEDQEEDNDKLE